MDEMPVLPTLEELVEDLLRRNPRFEIRWKDQAYPNDSWFWCARLWVVKKVARIFAPNYETGYVTMLYPHVWFPPNYRGKVDKQRNAMRHERVHWIDRYIYGWWFSFSYVMLLPLVFTYRAYWEERGYTQNLIMAKERHGQIPIETIQWVIKEFVGPSYGWMDRFWGRQRILKRALEVDDRKFMGLWPYPLKK